MLAAALSFVSVPAWAGLIVVAYVAWAFRRGGGATAITLLQEANRVLEKRVHHLEAQAKSDAALIAELRTHTDVTLALKPLVAWTESHEAVDAVRFQTVAQARTDLSGLELLISSQHQDSMAVLGAIKDTLQILASNKA